MRLEMQDQVREIALFRHTSSKQAKQEAADSLELLRANKRLAEAQNIIDKTMRSCINRNAYYPRIAHKGRGKDLLQPGRS